MLQIKWPLAALALLTPIALIGCGGSNGNGPSKTRPDATATATATATPTGAPINPVIGNQNFIGLLAGGTSLVFFRGNATGTATSRPVTGLPAGVRLRGIDARVAPATTGSNGVRAIYALGTNNQLYTLAVAAGGAAVTPVGTPATFDNFIPSSGTYGFDFNPAADRLRVVSGTQSTRINPNTGAAVDSDPTAPGINPDGSLRYDASDVNNGQIANITAAGYTNNDADTTTGTINYGIDSNRNLLVTQGRPAQGTNAAVSPNTGLLFTVGSLGADFSGDTGLEVFGTSNTAVAVSGRNFYSVNLATGRATNLGTINANANVTDVTVALAIVLD